MGEGEGAGLTSMRRMSMERTVVKKNICRKKSDTSPTTANRQNSWKRSRRAQHTHFLSGEEVCVRDTWMAGTSVK